MWISVIFASPQFSDEYADDRDKSNVDATTNDSLRSGPTVSTGGLLNPRSTIPFGGKQLLFFYDYETTGGSHYEDHIIEIGSTVIVPDNVSISTVEFSSLCHTSRKINPMGN